MANASDYLEAELRKHLFRTGSFVKPTVLAVALFTVSPADAGGGTEVAGGATLCHSDGYRDILDGRWIGAANLYRSRARHCND